MGSLLLFSKGGADCHCSVKLLAISDLSGLLDSGGGDESKIEKSVQFQIQEGSVRPIHSA